MIKPLASAVTTALRLLCVRASPRAPRKINTAAAGKDMADGIALKKDELGLWETEEATLCCLAWRALRRLSNKATWQHALHEARSALGDATSLHPKGGEAQRAGGLVPKRKGLGGAGCALS
jgi:hypothetical protein